MSLLRSLRDASSAAVRRFAGSRAKDSVARVIASGPVGHALAPIAGRIPCGDCTFDTRFSFVAPHVRASMFWGLYESAEIRCIQAHLRRGVDVVELGASLGVVSSHLAKRLTPGHRLLAVEANGRLLPAIEANVRRNAPDAAFAVRHVAIAYGVDEVQLDLGEDNLVTRVGALTVPLATTVPATTLTSLLAREGVTSDYALVMDIEGAEAGILLEDASALERCVQIIAELHDTEHRGRRLHVGALAGLAVSRGFDLRHRDGGVYVFERRG